MDKIKYALDQIIDNIAVLEDINTNAKVEVDINLLPNNLKEGAILEYDGNCYNLNLDEEKSRRASLRERLEKLKGLNKND